MGSIWINCYSKLVWCFQLVGHRWDQQYIMMFWRKIYLVLIWYNLVHNDRDDSKCWQSMFSGKQQYRDISTQKLCSSMSRLRTRTNILGESAKCMLESKESWLLIKYKLLLQSLIKSNNRNVFSSQMQLQNFPYPARIWLFHPEKCLSLNSRVYFGLSHLLLLFLMLAVSIKHDSFLSKKVKNKQL